MCTTEYIPGALKALWVPKAGQRFKRKKNGIVITVAEVTDKTAKLVNDRGAELVRPLHHWLVQELNKNLIFEEVV